MSIQEKIQDIFSTGIFNDEEIESTEGGFKSWAYYQIFHYTNEEWYYVDGELASTLRETADEELQTENGIIFCFS